MLTYLPPDQRPARPTYEYPWLLWLLAFVWLWPGVFGRDLWGQEAVYFAAIGQMADQGLSWPVKADGMTEWAFSPVYVWMSALGVRWLPFLHPYEAARLAGVGLAALTLIAVGGTGRLLLGRRHGRTAALVFVGSPGLLMTAHFLNGNMALVCGLAWCFYALAWSRVRVVPALAASMAGGLLLGFSGSLLFLSAWLLVWLLLAFSPVWRNPVFIRTTAVSASVLLPGLVLVLLAVFRLDWQVFPVWLERYALMPFGGFGEVGLGFSLWPLLKNLVWVAFPAWPLALWTWRRRVWRGRAWWVLCMAWLGVFSLLLLFSPSVDEEGLLVLLPPLAVLAAAEADTLKRTAASFFNGLGIAVFGFLAVFIWVGFVAMNFGWPERLARRSAYFSPFYRPDVDYLPLLVALLFSVVWLVAITRKYVRGRQAVTNWAAGLTLCWSLLLTLFLPWFDAAKSYRPVVAGLEAVGLSDGACVYAENRTIRLAWQQYGSLPLAGKPGECAYVLALASQTVPDHWQRLAEAGRPRQKHERFVLWFVPSEP